MAGRLRTPKQGLNSHQASLVQRASITPQQILENLDGLNEEIEESYDMGLVPAEDITPADTTAEVLEPLTVTPVEKEEIVEEDLDAQLAAEVAAAEAALAERARQAAEEAKEAEETAEAQEELDPVEAQRQAILDLLRRTPGAPTEEQIEALKQKYGKHGIHVLALGEGDVYIFTYLRRGQWHHLQKIVQGAAAKDVGGSPDELLKEKVIQYTVKWPRGVSSPEFVTNSRAGVIDTLYQMILLNSYFLSPQQAMMLTAQL